MRLSAESCHGWYDRGPRIDISATYPVIDIDGAQKLHWIIFAVSPDKRLARFAEVDTKTGFYIIVAALSQFAGQIQR